MEEQLQKIQNVEKELKELKELAPKQASIQQQITEVSQSIRKLNQDLVPTTGSLFVRLFLGQVNVKQYRESDRFRLKQEYQKFKR
jgi:hypothetical protein